MVQGSREGGMGRNVVSCQRKEEGNAAPPCLTGDLCVTVAAEARSSAVDLQPGLPLPTRRARQNRVDSYASPRSCPLGPAKGSDGAATRFIFAPKGAPKPVMPRQEHGWRFSAYRSWFRRQRRDGRGRNESRNRRGQTADCQHRLFDRKLR